jgi:hypothetical protein
VILEARSWKLDTGVNAPVGSVVLLQDLDWRLQPVFWPAELQTAPANPKGGYRAASIPDPFGLAELPASSFRQFGLQWVSAAVARNPLPTGLERRCSQGMQ